ncbi:mechanosensitive ion channel family protein, partial [Escherichia coli]|nr:mechanosensitive ion channel family protein [Escherichia coli]
MQRSRLRVPVFTWLVGILMAMFLAGAAQSAGLSLAAMTQKANAQPASAPPASAPLAQSLDQVINTLQNEGERQALVKQLQAVRTGLDASAAGAAGAASAAGASAPSPG